jgi:hypothetical protein
LDQLFLVVEGFRGDLDQLFLIVAGFRGDLDQLFLVVEGFRGDLGKEVILMLFILLSFSSKLKWKFRWFHLPGYFAPVSPFQPHLVVIKTLLI